MIAARGALGAGILLWLLLAHALPASAQSQAINTATGSAEGEEDALWELGAGVAGASTPQYPGSAGSTARALPVPVVIYRGDFLRLGDGSLASGRLIANPRFELDVSLNGSFDAESDDVPEREGMPDLGFLFEIGPELEVRLNSLDDADRRLKLELPVRAIFSLDDGTLNGRGAVFSPQLEYERDFANDRFEWSVSITPSFITRRAAAYFYEVDAAFARPGRPAYEATGGYLQTTLGGTLQFDGERSFAAIGVRYGALAGGANVDSPLFRDDTQWSVFAVAVWRFWESKARAAPD